MERRGGEGEEKEGVRGRGGGRWSKREKMGNERSKRRGREGEVGGGGGLKNKTTAIGMYVCNIYITI